MRKKIQSDQQCEFVFLFICTDLTVLDTYIVALQRRIPSAAHGSGHLAGGTAGRLGLAGGSAGRHLAGRGPPGPRRPAHQHLYRRGAGQDGPGSWPLGGGLPEGRNDGRGLSGVAGRRRQCLQSLQHGPS